MIDPAPHADAYDEAVRNLQDLRESFREEFGPLFVHLKERSYRVVPRAAVPIHIEMLIDALDQQAKVNAMLVAALDERS